MPRGVECGMQLSQGGKGDGRVQAAQSRVVVWMGAVVQSGMIDVLLMIHGSRRWTAGQQGESLFKGRLFAEASRLGGEADDRTGWTCLLCEDVERRCTCSRIEYGKYG